jgi:hypothetical protein
MKKNMTHSIVATLVYILLIFATVCQSGTGSMLNNDNPASVIVGDPNKDAILYTKNDLEKIYNDIKAKSFVDTPKNSQLIFKDLSPAFGMAHPFSLNIIVDIDSINKHQWPKEAVVGLFAHELSHMVSYERQGFFGRMLFTWNYPFSLSKRQKVEHEADQIAIDRGYGSELIQERIYQFRIDDKDHLMKQKKVYYWPETLKEIIANTKQGT